MPNCVFNNDQFEIHRIITGGQWKENCYLVEHYATREMLLLDPGGDADAISSIINRKNGNLKCILLTHAHHDHIGAVKELSEAYDAPCYLHKADAKLLRLAPMYAARFTGKMVTAPDNVALFEELLEITIGNCLISALLTPGHTPGSVCYLFEGFLFSGDTLLFEHVGRTDLPGGSVQAITQSVSQLMHMNFEHVNLFPGHGRPWSMDEAKDWWQEIQTGPPEYNKFE